MTQGEITKGKKKIKSQWFITFHGMPLTEVQVKLPKTG